MSTLIISDKVQSYIKRAFKFGEKIHCHPFLWDEWKNGPKLVETRNKKLLWCFHASVVFIHYIYVLVRCIQVNTGTKEGKEVEIYIKLYTRFICVLFLLPVLWQMFIILNIHYFPTFTYSYLQLMGNFKNDSRLKNARRLMKLCHLYMQFTYYGFLLVSVLMVTLLSIRTDSPDSIASLLILILQRPLNLFETMLHAGFLVYIGYMYMANTFLITFSGLPFLFSVLELIHELQCWCSPETFDEKTAVRFLRVYSYVRILLKAQHRMYGNFILPATKVIVICMAIFCTYGFIRLGGILSVALGAVGFIATTFICLMFSFVAQFPSRSAEISYALNSLSGYKSIRNKTILGKSLRSLPPFKIYMNNFYFVDKGMVLFMIKFITEASVTFLLANTK